MQWLTGYKWNVQVGTTTGEGSLTCDAPNLQRQHQQQQMSLENHQQHYPHQHHVAETAYHVSRPSHAMSAIISPSPLRHTSIILDDDSFHVSRIMENFPVSYYIKYMYFYVIVAHNLEKQIFNIYGQKFQSRTN